MIHDGRQRSAHRHHRNIEGCLRLKYILFLVACAFVWVVAPSLRQFARPESWSRS